MRAKLVNEAIKHLSPKSELELEPMYNQLSTTDKFLTGLEHNNEDLVKLAMSKRETLDQLGNLFLENKPLSVEIDTACHIKKGRIVRDEESDYFIDFLKDHNIEYTVIQVRGPGGGWPYIEYTGLARDIIQLVMGPFDTGLTGDERIEDIEFYIFGDSDDE
jgi:hypothetical protein